MYDVRAEAWHSNMQGTALLTIAVFGPVSTRKQAEKLLEIVAAKPTVITAEVREIKP
jgi:hypothetical protein